MTLSICNYNKIYICIVGAQDFQVSDSSFRTPLESPFEKFLDPRLDNSYRSLSITGIISPVGVLVPFMKDTTTLCLMIVMANFDDTLSITKYNVFDPSVN